MLAGRAADAAAVLKSFRILDGRYSCGISPLWITLAVIAWGSLFASYCDRVTLKLRLCNLLVELDSLQKSGEETRHEIAGGRDSKPGEIDFAAIAERFRVRVVGPAPF